MRSTHERGLKIGIISQWFFPEPVPIPGSLSQGLERLGHSVRVLTGFPSYPAGRLYQGHDSSAATEETLAGAQVLRVPAFLSHDLNALRRIRSFLSFGWQSLRHARFLRDSDVNYVYATPMTAAVTAVACRLLWKTPFVLHVQDLWPESVTDSGMVRDGWKKSLISVLLNLALRPVYAKAHHIMVISPGMKHALTQRGVDATKISVVLNWDGNEPNPENSQLEERPRPINQTHRLHFVYAGNIGQMQDVESIVRAAAAVEGEFDFQVSLYGSGVAEAGVAALIEELGVQHVRLMGRVGAKEMRSVYSGSDFQFVTLKDRPVFRMTIPSKFQASMANGIPVITTVQGDLARICRENAVGFVADAESPTNLANAIRQAAGMGTDERLAMSQRAKDFYEQNLTAKVGVKLIAHQLAQAVYTAPDTSVPGHP